MLGLREERPYTVLMSYEEERERETDFFMYTYAWPAT
jgi:hypothetical protein